MMKKLLSLSIIALGLWACQQDLERASTALQLGDYTRAERLYDLYLDGNPADSAARLGLALARLGLAQSEAVEGECALWLKAVRAASTLVATDSSKSNLTVWQRTHLGLGKCKLEASEVGEALEHMDLVLRQDSAVVDAWALKAEVYEGLGKWKLAQAMYEKWAVLSPKDPHPLLGEARVHLAQRDTGSAVELVMTASALDSNSIEAADLRFRLGFP